MEHGPVGAMTVRNDGNVRLCEKGFVALGKHAVSLVSGGSFSYLVLLTPILGEGCPPVCGVLKCDKALFVPTCVCVVKIYSCPVRELVIAICSIIQMRKLRLRWLQWLDLSHPSTTQHK
jgi:hypothetical protein